MMPDDDAPSSSDYGDGPQLSVEAARKIVAENLLGLSDELASLVHDLPQLRNRLMAPRAALMDAIALLFPDGVEL